MAPATTKSVSTDTLIMEAIQRRIPRDFCRAPEQGWTPIASDRELVQRCWLPRSAAVLLLPGSVLWTLGLARTYPMRLSGCS
jgi:hypothetical protein